MVSQETPRDLSSELNDVSKQLCQKMTIAGKFASADDTTGRPSTVSSAPSSSKVYAVTPEIQQTITLCCNRKSNSFVENKYKCTITSERLAQLKKLVDTAVKDHKVFTIKGQYLIAYPLRDLLNQCLRDEVCPKVFKIYRN